MYMYEYNAQRHKWGSAKPAPSARSARTVKQIYDYCM